MVTESVVTMPVPVTAAAGRPTGLRERRCGRMAFGGCHGSP